MPALVKNNMHCPYTRKTGFYPLDGSLIFLQRENDRDFNADIPLFSVLTDIFRKCESK
ncbi:hypothetical protein LEP1GSC058_3014 [Leptospira fainei serovar Hurstbridge str. BUT 6]|uniref:Uncharacterized protein n=1 Tax=Leptospira fainei serovar Hurstbridge str. BUT 6 TaxID=1193011 RepID=S3V9R4_9LEPT|nr:hypothetical protein LEP1GSC058_3014 [Leptospira fainei serovar Hurstbridge str. BUT 6]